MYITLDFKSRARCDTFNDKFHNVNLYFMLDKSTLYCKKWDSQRYC